MAEHYAIGRVPAGPLYDGERAQEMVHWGKILGSLSMVPYVTGKGWAGNMGFRQDACIYVTPSGGEIDNIQVSEIMGIRKEGSGLVYFGHQEKKPTSEWEIYWEIFQRRDDISAIIHGHDVISLETAEGLRERCPADVGLTRIATESGSAEFREEISACLTDKNVYLIGREHGFFALGRSFEDVGLLALRFRNTATELLIGHERYQELLRKYHCG